MVKNGRVGRYAIGNNHADYEPKNTLPTVISIASKCNDITKNCILPPNNVVPQKQLWLEQSGCQATHKVNKGVGLYRAIERESCDTPIGFHGNLGMRK